MKKLVFPLLTLSIALCMSSCSKDEDNKDDDTGDDETLVGQPGNPRFNLKFTNEENVDLDLYVETPNGVVLSYNNSEDDGGRLDVDCLCDECPQGPNENIYWEDGTAPTGTYKYWVEYFGSCEDGSGSSSYTLRVVKNNNVIATKTGTLNASGDSSDKFAHTQE